MVPYRAAPACPARGTLACAIALLVAIQARGMVSVMEGNAPLSNLDDKAWPGLLAVLNDESRALYTEGPTTEQTAFYRGDTTALERVLGAFANVAIEERVVVLLPGRGEGFPWSDKDSPYDWRLEVNQGEPWTPISAEYRALIRSPHPTLTVFVGGTVDLERLRIPRAITVVGVGTLRESYRQALLSDDENVRSLAAWQLSQLDPYGKESAAAVENLPPQEKAWNRVAKALKEIQERRRDSAPVRARYEAEERRIRTFVFARRYGWVKLAVGAGLIVAVTLLIATVAAAKARRGRKQRD